MVFETIGCYFQGGFFNTALCLASQTGFDWLFWTWVLVTVLLFIDIIIPDPIPYIDEAILAIAFFSLLILLAFRASLEWLATTFNSFVGIITHPAVIAFTATLVVLLVYSKIKGGRRK